MKKIRTKDIDVIILCGGLGTRLRDVVDDRPKAMVEIDGRPFLDILVEYVARYGFTRFILCTGFKGDLIKRYFENKRGRLISLVSDEDQPLGTAGAIKNAESFIESNMFLVLNGDSLCEIDIEDFIKFHIGKGALISIAVTTMESPVEYGVIRLDKDQKIISFGEKIPIEGNGLINAGMYVFDKKILKEIPSGQKLSLEYGLFPGILDKGLYGYVTERRLLDLGTPERLELARKYFGRVKQSRIG
jgi:D-glycero-alpha-D-manno-heptose 1-phosphate guanylyltransferase